MQVDLAGLKLKAKEIRALKVLFNSEEVTPVLKKICQHHWYHLVLAALQPDRPERVAFAQGAVAGFEQAFDLLERYSTTQFDLSDGDVELDWLRQQAKGSY